MWLALIALWGSSDHWDLAGVRRRLGHALDVRHRHDSKSDLD
jgi:hypothetical protein